MTDPILSIEEAADQTPWSKTTLYRVAKEDPDSPFWKRAGRWATTHSRLIRWLEEGEKPAIRRPVEDPMPRRRKAPGGSVLAEVEELQRRAA